MYQNYEFPKKPNVYDTLDGKPDYQKVWAGKSRFADRDQVKIKEPSFFGCNSYADYELGKVIRAAKQYAPDAMIISCSNHYGIYGSSHSQAAGRKEHFTHAGKSGP